MMDVRKSFPTFVTLLAGFAFLTAGSAWAQIEPDDSRLIEGPTVAELVRYAYAQSPTVEAARAAWRASVESHRAVTGYPDPQLMVTYFPEPIETRLGPQDWNATLAQPIPFPGKLTRRGETAEAGARMAHIRMDRSVRDLAVAVRESAHELWYVRRAREVSGEQGAQLDRLRKIAETAHGDGRVQLADVVRAQSQTAQVRYDALLLEELEVTERAQLNGLLNRAPDAPIGPIALEPVRSLPYTLDELTGLAATGRDEVRLAEAGVERAAAAVRAERYAYYPDFKLGLFYAGIGDPDVPSPPDDAGQDAVGVQFGMTIPLWWSKSNGKVARAEAERAKAKAQLTAQVNRTRVELHRVHFKLKNAERLIALYRDELLPQAAASLDTAESWFREGEGSYADFLETQAVHHNFRLALARARADYGKTLARLEALVGQVATKRIEPEAETATEPGAEAGEVSP